MIQEFVKHLTAFKSICACEKQLKRRKLTSDQWASQNRMAKATFYASRKGKDAKPGLWQEMVDFAADHETAPTPKSKPDPSVCVKDFNDNFPRWAVCDRVIARTHNRILETLNNCSVRPERSEAKSKDALSRRERRLKPELIRGSFFGTGK